MPSTDHKLRVFLCHAKEDKPIVRDLYHQLTSEGWMDVWLDEEKLLPGQEWDVQIEEAVENADVVIVLLSNDSVTKKGYVQKELSSVLDVAEYNPEGTIFIIPILLEPCQIPRRLKRYQYQEYFADRPHAYSRLISSLEIRSQSIGINVEEIKTVIQRQKQERIKREKENQIRKEAEERIRRTEEQIIRQKAEEETRQSLEKKFRKHAEEKVVKEEHDRIIKQKAEVERVAHEKTEWERKLQEEELRRVLEEKKHNPVKPLISTSPYVAQLKSESIVESWWKRMFLGAVVGVLIGILTYLFDTVPLGMTLLLSISFGLTGLIIYPSKVSLGVIVIVFILSVGLYIGGQTASSPPITTATVLLLASFSVPAGALGYRIISSYRGE